MSGTNSNIDIFLRVRPVKRPSERLCVDTEENRVEFKTPRDSTQGYVNNQRENYEFRFNGILTAEAKQDEVFERVARPVLSGAMEGYNGTIFAYGQTASGKTFTMTGGPERYVDRGIIPRTISAMFSEIAKRSEYQYAVRVSYLEIYNEKGYDLLDPEREVKALEDLTRVYVGEDDEGGVSYRNLRFHHVGSEEDALNQLFLGDTNRVIGTTLMNQSSSRSHCIFTIYIEARKNGEDVVRRSKLNLVDLAGSERVSKTGADGDTLMQAKYINVSLHFLEQVVIALQERAMGIPRPHVPYRNSMMTTALKDSLGGNCRTVMIATINSEQLQLDESISTCRFAVRIAMVSNKVVVNEEVDPTLIIRRLKQEVRDLKEEVRVLQGAEEQRGDLTPDEVARLKKQIEAYCADNEPDASLNLGGSMLFIRSAFNVFKAMVRAGPGTLALPGSGGKVAGDGGGAVSADQMDQIKKLKLQVQQRDNEINILVSMLQRRDGGTGRPSGPQLLQGAAGSPLARSSAATALPSPPGHQPGTASPAASGGGGAGAANADDLAALMNTDMLGDRNKAFELFRKSYRQNEVIEENKALLKQKYDAAKAVGQEVNDSKGRITELKTLIEQRRVQRIMAGEESADDPEEERCKDLIEEEKRRYKDAFGQLRDLKKEIEHLHMLLEQSRARLQRDFEQWMGMMARQREQRAAGGLGSPAPASPSHVQSPMRSSMQQSEGPPTRPRMAWAETSPATVATRPVLTDGMPQSPSLTAAAGVSPMAGSSAAPFSTASVDPQVLELARPYLTGNAAADEDIIKFYEAKAKLMAQMGR
uniref:Kinesin-like protein n=1 Tax=Chlamydomonas euryale TaxID=1486919 RepID=A0A7R9YQE6_9CHLO|mmetsp:Transcript_11056/g.32897  ORF Transcript_11056/g.32897 Transcript_11056/m.32897 type:complete len:816 (+) Transcript_11056:243-2690(+)